MGLGDLGFVAGRGRPLVIGIIGPQNAGKTTLLAAWYLLLSRGAAELGGREFAGSYSLDGWEAIAGALRWNPGYSPSFPPHTTSRSGRAPGLLHLSLTQSMQLADYLLTDAPGEWFQRWAINRDTQDGDGARWIAEHAGVFLLIADRAALSSENKGSARSDLQLLARRVSVERGTRPVALVWTKADLEVEPAIEHSVRQAVLDVMPDAKEFSISVVSEGSGETNAGLGFAELLQWSLTARRARVELPPSSVPRNGDPLFRYGAEAS
ncbi:TRAFAC clade GTPase domain-containing protein [Kribbella sp. WER1]